MAAYAQFGYGYPSENQLLDSSGGVDAVGQSTAATDLPQAGVPATSAPSPLSGANEASLSPSGGSTSTAVTTDPVSPGVISQNSNNAGSGANAGVSATVDNTPSAAGIAGIGNISIASAGGASCCENGRLIMTDPVSGHTVCSCQYDSARLAFSGYSRMPSTNVSVYGAPYPSTEQNPYPSIGVDSTAFYSPLGNPYSLKESGASSDMSAWTSAGLQPTTSYYSYDPTLAAYGYSAGYDLAARRKNATRESTATLKAWLNEHKKNPYPTKGEKIMLAIITKMTLTQVSTWFANARRRLKKENKMTWEPKNKTEDDDDAVLSDDEKEIKEVEGSGKPDIIYGNPVTMIGDQREDLNNLKTETAKGEKADELAGEHHKAESLTTIRNLSSQNPVYSHPNQYYQQHHPNHYQHGSDFLGGGVNEDCVPKNLLSRDCGIPIPATKPKIWSLADTVACKTPPPPIYQGQQYYSPQQPPHHPHPHVLSNINRSNTAAGQLSQMHQHSQQQDTVSPNSPLSTMNRYAVVSPYSRIATVYGGNAFGTNTINNSTGTPVTPTTSPAMSARQNHYQYQQHQYQTQQQLQRMGFLEIQPDTPPQTPPNMKHSNASGLAANPLLMGPTAALASSMCYTSSSTVSLN